MQEGCVLKEFVSSQTASLLSPTTAQHSSLDILSFALQLHWVKGKKAKRRIVKMGVTASSSSRCEEDEAEELTGTAAASEAQGDGSPDDKLLQKNGQISNLNVKTRSHADELNGHYEERVLADVGSGFVTLKEDGAETTEDLQEMDALQPNIKNESTEMVNADGEEPKEDNQVNDINEVGFKKIFRFVGFKFTLKKDTCEKTEANEQEERVASPSEDSNDTQENSAVAANENTTDETHKSEAFSQPDAAEPFQQTDNETELDPDIQLVKHHVEDTPDKEMAKESPEPEEQMSPIKQFFTQGIFASLRKRKKEEEIQKESKEDELKRIEKTDTEYAEREDSKCMCIDIPYILSEEEKDSVEKADDTLLPEGELLNFIEKDKVEGSPLKRLFRKFSTRKQRESKAAEKVIEAEEQVSEQPKAFMEVTEKEKDEEPVIGEPKPAEEELVADVSPQESKKKSDTTVSWEALICGGSSKKRARKTNENETEDKGEENEKTTDSPLGSSFEGDYDHLTSSNEQTGSPAEGEMRSTWKMFKKMVTPKRKVRTGESSTPEQIPSDSEMNKDDSFSKKKLIPGHKKRKSEARQEQTSSDEAARDNETDDEDDETPAIIPLSEYEIIEPESLKEVNEQRVEITIEHEKPEMALQVLEKDTSNDKIAATISSNTGPTVIHGLSEDFEELTDFVSKHQQLSDIPEEGIIEESIVTPVSSAEWTTQDDTLSEDIVELTADAVTAPEPASEQFIGDDTTEMVSAVSQLTESPWTSGHVTPVSAEYSVQTSDVILQEAIQSICMTPSVQSVTTKDERQESLAVSSSPYIVQSYTQEEKTVLVAHKKTEATAICTGLVSQEIESVEEHLPAHLVEAIPEVSDAVPTEFVSDNLTDEPEAAEHVTDEVYEAEIKYVKTEYQEIIVNEEESGTETQLDIEQVIQLVEEPLMEESEETHMEGKTEECTTGVELGQMIDTMQSEAGLDQAMSDYTNLPETECPLYPELEEPVYEQQLAAKPEKELKLPDVELSPAEFEQAALAEVVETLTHGVVDNISDTTTSKTSDVPEEEIEMIASVEECLESKESIISSDHIVAETLELEDNLEAEVVSIQVDVCEVEVGAKDTVLLAGDSAVTVEDISEKMAENISEAIEESLSREQMPAKVVSLPESVLVEQAEEIYKEDIDTDMDNNKGDDSASDRMDRIFVKEVEELAVKEEQLLANTESNETDNQEVSADANTTDESPEKTVDADTENGETVHEIREDTVVPSFSKDVSEHIETPAELDTSCEVMLTPQETALPEVEARPVPIEIVGSQTVECSEDTKHSPEPPKENEQPMTNENIKTGKVLEMVAIIENTTKHSGTEKLAVVEPVAQALAISEPTEQEGDASEMTVVHAEAIDGEQAVATLMKETAVPEEKVMMAIAPKSDPEKYDSGTTVIEVAATTVLAQNDTAAQMEVSNVSEHMNEADEDGRLKCEPLEQLIETTLSNELQLDKAEIKDEIPAVMEATHIAQVLPLSSEVTAEMPDISVSEIQTQVVSELRAATLEVTEPEVEMPVVTEVKVETAVVTELEVEKPIVTSVVTELEVETLVVTSMAKTTDTLNSVVTPQNQNIDTDTSVLTTVIKEQEEEVPTVISVVVTPATPLDEVTQLGTLGKESMVVASVEDTPVVTVAAETPNVESVIVRTAVAPVVDIQNVIPVVPTPDLDSVLGTVAASSVFSAAVVTTVAEAAVVETPVVSFTDVKSTPVLVAAVIENTNVSPVVEIPAVQSATVGPVIMSLAVTSVAETSAVTSMTETVPPEVTLDVTPIAETTVSQVIKTPVTSITSVKPTVAAVTQTPVIEIPAIIPETVPETVSSVLTTSAETLVASEQNMTLVVETPAVSSIAVAETSQVAEIPDQISVILTEAATIVTPAATLAAEMSAVIPVVETAVVKPTSVALVETPVVTPEITSTVTPIAERAVVSLGQEAIVEAPTAITVVERPVTIPVVQTPALVSVTEKEAAPPAVTAAAEKVVSTVVETQAVKPTVSVAETPVVTPEMITSTVTPVAERAVVSLGQEAIVEAPTAMTVVERPVTIPVVQTPALVSVTVKEAAPPVVLPPVTAAAETVVSTIVETQAVKPTVSVAETPVPVASAPVVPLVKVTPVVAVIETPSTQTSALAPVMVTTAIGPVVEVAAAALVVVTPEVQEPMLQMVEQEKKEEKTEATVVPEDVEPLLAAAKEEKTPILPEENAKGPLQHEPVTSTEPQSEVEDDVWEDAVDNIGDSQGLVTHTDVTSQDTAAKQTSDAAI
ncbi:A-kinase anchor protein 12 [Pimephales promelas]|uniref:A-kinase anchor protein 12 n=1 Tax=Pimephales promelas TaxID=90988 RepID=UPI001955E30F|nr:A-kinase anchor protein 12 [Pimephales promelas]KAG1946562.1 putative threonine-rich GPI-anchored glycoprotein [Pimephales promelas]